MLSLENKCGHYAGNQYCNYHKSKVASAYCGDICELRPKESLETEGSDLEKDEDVK